MKMLRNIIKFRFFITIIASLSFNSCADYLNVIPDGIATIENAFTMRSEAEKYLFTCYSYMPKDGSLAADPAIMGGDEFWSVINPNPPVYNDEMFRIARGFQNSISPLGNSNWINLYRALRDCNIFLENVDKVPDLSIYERNIWKAEVTFLKAYYHFYLVRMYGPIPLIKTNISITADDLEVKVSREPVDSCFNYIVSLIDEAVPNLMLNVDNPTKELGRITQPIALAWKAKVLVTAASPLFNGNSDQATLSNRDGTRLFNTTYEESKWTKAMEACKVAIDMCHSVGMQLYQYKPQFSQYKLTDTTLLELTIRNTFCEKWNSEIIWANTQTGSGNMLLLQRLSTANLDSRYGDNSVLRSQLQPPLKIAEMFYTDRGVPISEDIKWQNINPFALRTAEAAEQLYIKKGYTTIELHFDREPRFYASLGFDGGIWYGQGKYESKPDELFYIACRIDGTQATKGANFGPYTGYFWKKCVHFQNVQSSTSGYDINYYPWPIMRLADLYLLYAEAINEAEGPEGTHQNELFNYIDMIRARAGLEGVKKSWDTYTSNTKYQTQLGMRQIIHQERLIELALEGQRFWDIRRWKEAPDHYKRVLEGWKLNEGDPAKFYQKIPLIKQNFAIKDYFWPIQDSYIENNRNLVQNIGW